MGIKWQWREEINICMGLPTIFDDKSSVGRVNRINDADDGFSQFSGIKGWSRWREETESEMGEENDSYIWRGKGSSRLILKWIFDGRPGWWNTWWIDWYLLCSCTQTNVPYSAFNACFRSKLWMHYGNWVNDKSSWWTRPRTSIDEVDVNYSIKNPKYFYGCYKYIFFISFI